ncbi:DUF3037 domain-containing protein [Pararhodonellum marinum]|uniref:DUF3037 domain-containing protein n=1 Tax=Pararhodonellum marinum TaxID=2755358 RepID=UPI00188EA704|nr:DUF3037 domain-containing protein [Pararhodonellum marinum]
MQGKHLYEYAVVRAVPRVEREEFVNVGVMVCCKKTNELLCKFLISRDKLLALDKEADLSTIETYLQSFKQVCQGDPNGSPISHQDAASRFRWLTAMRSSIIQTSRPHVGFADDLEEVTRDLFDKFVG